MTQAKITLHGTALSGHTHRVELLLRAPTHVLEVGLGAQPARLELGAARLELGSARAAPLFGAGGRCARGRIGIDVFCHGCFQIAS